jgi:hypothetical protein
MGSWYSRPYPARHPPTVSLAANAAESALTETNTSVVLHTCIAVDIAVHYSYQCLLRISPRATPISAKRRDSCAISANGDPSTTVSNSGNIVLSTYNTGIPSSTYTSSDRETTDLLAGGPVSEMSSLCP